MAKLFFTLAALCVFGAVMVEGFNSPVLPQGSWSVLKTCLSEFKANDGNVQEVMHDATNISKKANSLLACVMRKIKLMVDNGQFMADTAVTSVKKDTGVDDEKLKIAEEIDNDLGEPAPRGFFSALGFLVAIGVGILITLMK